MKYLLPWLGALCLGDVSPLWITPDCPREDDEGKVVQATVEQSDLKENPTRITKVAAKGDTLEVRLEFKATGYTWKLVKCDPAQFKYDGKVETERGENKPGAPEYKVFRFVVQDQGKLVFHLARPFGKSEPKILELQVHLRK
jgi:predicted secreted protein